MKHITRALLVLSLLILPTFVLAQSDTNGFVSLTQIDAVTFAGNADSLPAFLNSVYKIAIGLAAVIGVLQLMRAGLTWMTAAGSHEKIGQARTLIRDTVLGLLLVLAPTIVFSIINPDILSLKISGIDQLNTTISDVAGSTGGSSVADRILWSDSTSSYQDALLKCAGQGGYVVPNCKPEGSDTITPIPEGGTCVGTLVNICVQATSSQSTNSVCSAYKQISAATAGACDGSKGFSKISDSCCAGLASGGVCCGSTEAAAATGSYSPTNPPPSMIPNTIGTSNPTPNPACKISYPDGAIVSWDQAETACCEYQDAYGISCTPLRNSADGGQTQFCSCSAN